MTMPRRTQLLAIAAIVLSGLWGWAWLGLEWSIELPSSPQQRVPTTPTTPLPSSSGTQPQPDVSAFLERPAFYPDRRMHPYRPGAEEETEVPKTTLDFELTTTVIGAQRSFAVLRLKGGGTSVIARPGEAFEADPAWHMTKLDRISATFVNAQGVLVTVGIKPPAPNQVITAVNPPSAMGAAMVAKPAIPAPSSSPPPAQAPVTAVQPMQENADVRARIEARRREMEARAQSARTK